MAAQQIGEDVNLVHEVLRRVDPTTLARCSLVNRMWQEAAEDEEIWTPIWHGMGYNENDRASVLRALGSSRRLLSIFLWPLSAGVADIGVPLMASVMGLHLLGLMSLCLHDKPSFLTVETFGFSIILSVFETSSPHTDPLPNSSGPRRKAQPAVSNVYALWSYICDYCHSYNPLRHHPEKTSDGLLQSLSLTLLVSSLLISSSVWLLLTIFDSFILAIDGRYKSRF